ncbi:putative nitrate reductase [Amylocarpus encephaloides]|uniref:Nitrate reductase n=1 Tax=Amylocarpus encephaloides TaxID=45428 RepID=A0A9P7YMI1_9HELO|nr:putative nitrate reductase [Amylocarpus encephaloides]
MSTDTLSDLPRLSEGNVKGVAFSALPTRLPPSPPKSIYNGSESDQSTPASRRQSTSQSQPRYPLPPPAVAPTTILKEDIKTPDNHVPRDSRLIRLTGIHPFNVEAPLSALYDEGYLTSPELFYVRNHGPVPEVDDASIPDWEFSIEGLVQSPITMTLKQLMSDYEQITVPITLVCAGNRRKEQNQVRKSKGFSWGAAGVSTALWTGVALSDVISKACPMRGAKYVCMEGADKLPNGYYGTSLKLSWAMDPNRGIMLAYKMNGEILRPDHGKPLRVVVPGQIGGRSVKWLKKLIITAAPSDNWYHIYDNRVLPTMISPDQSANEPKWWTDERYAIYDLSTNSATAYPAHGEMLSLTNGPETYRVKGYAYGGGGRRVTRVEVTLDKGKSWALAEIRYHEDDYRDNADENEVLFGGKLDVGWRETCFTWCFWEIDIKVADMTLASDIMVRGMDESMNVQPRDMYWSVLGMMNNPWYRLTISKEDDFLRFEHPTQPALLPGGWMEKVKERGGNLANGFWGEKMGGAEEEEVVEKKSEVKMTKDGLTNIIPLDDFKKHDGDADPWFVVNGEVYDGTAFLENHPGGATSIAGAAGQDASDEFMGIRMTPPSLPLLFLSTHNPADSETAKLMMQSYHIGTLSPQDLKTLNSSEDTPAESSEPRPIFLQSKSWTKALLSAKNPISSDTRVFTFTLDHPSQIIGLPIGQHLMVRLRDPVTRESIIRSYTPLSEGNQQGTLDILIKIYFDTVERAGGRMTKALDSIPVGHYVEFKGPIGKFEYLGNGSCTISGRPRFVKRFVMICGGSGITPIFQVLRAVLSNATDKTRCLVLDGNRLEADILCRSEIDALVEGKGERVRLLYTLTQPTDTWTGIKGRVGRELLESEIGACGKTGEDLVLICGPESLEKSVKGVLNGMGWGDEDLLFF